MTRKFKIEGTVIDEYAEEDKVSADDIKSDLTNLIGELDLELEGELNVKEINE